MSCHRAENRNAQSRSSGRSDRPACRHNASETRIISLTPDGQPVGFGTQVVDVSGNGPFAGLISRQLIPEDSTGVIQVQVYDLVTDEIERISLKRDGTPSNDSVAGYESPIPVSYRPTVATGSSVSEPTTSRRTSRTWASSRSIAMIERSESLKS